MTQPKYSEWEKIKLENIDKVYKAQEKRCMKKEEIIFITPGGFCPNCDLNYLADTTIEEATVEHITCCKFCAWSFVE